MSLLSVPLARIQPYRGFLLIAFLCLAACGRPQMLELHGQTMGTTYSLKLPRPPESIDQQRLQSDVDALLAAINAEMSTYDPDSSLSRLNAAPAGEWQQVPPRLMQVLQAAADIHDLSKGLFDPTVGPLVNLWGFGPAKRAGFPDEGQIRTVLQQVGFRRNLRLDAATSRVLKSRADIYIDLSAIAKGFAVDQLAELIEARGVTEYLVEVGGEVRTAGRNARNMLWRVAVELPTADERRVHGILQLEAAAVATSGDYRNFFEHEGRRYSHTIDPRTGYPVTHALASVTVVDAEAMRADALATTLLALGPEAGMQLAREQKLAIWMIVREGDEWIDLRSPAMDAYQVN